MKYLDPVQVEQGEPRVEGGVRLEPPATHPAPAPAPAEPDLLLPGRRHPDLGRVLQGQLEQLLAVWAHTGTRSFLGLV